MLKHTGEYPIIGVNTFLSKSGSPTLVPGEVIRATEEEKSAQLQNVEALKTAHSGRAEAAIQAVQATAVAGGNVFEALMDACKVTSLGRLTDALFEVGGAYRRNM